MDSDIRNTIAKFCLVYSFACLVGVAMCGWQAAVAWIFGMAGVAVAAKMVTRINW